MGSLCSCFKGRYPEEEIVDDAEVEDETLHLFSHNRSNNAAESSELSVTLGGPKSTICVLNHSLSVSSKSSDEDVCPTCFEGYTDQNPKIIARCRHHYHLGCIYDWKERSETCPACRKVMDFAEAA